MKSLEELKAIRDRMQNKVIIREGGAEKRIVVGMATCGIAAGARPVLNTFVEEIAKRNLTGTVEVGQTGCIGMCRFDRRGVRGRQARHLHLRRSRQGQGDR